MSPQSYDSITYEVAEHTTSELYEALEPRLNSGQVVLLDVPMVEQQLLGLRQQRAERKALIVPPTVGVPVLHPRPRPRTPIRVAQK